MRLFRKLLISVIFTGLDPAGPFFTEARQNSLTTSSAQYVQVLHTSIVGVKENIGHIDFWANRFLDTQPGCGRGDISCSHTRSTEIYYASCFQDYQFIGSSCAGCKPTCGTARFGYFNTEHQSGCYQFKTSGCFGYALDTQ